MSNDIVTDDVYDELKRDYNAKCAELAQAHDRPSVRKRSNCARRWRRREINGALWDGIRGSARMYQEIVNRHASRPVLPCGRRMAMSDDIEAIREFIAREKSPGEGEGLIREGRVLVLLAAYDAKCVEVEALREALEAQGIEYGDRGWHTWTCGGNRRMGCLDGCAQARAALGKEVTE